MSNNSDPVGIQLDDYGRRVEMDVLNSRIVGLFLESLVCGIFMVTYTLGAWSLLHRDRRTTLSRRNKIILGVNTLMLALAVAHLCLTLQTTLYGFVVKGDTRDDAYNALVGNDIFSSPVGEAQFYLYVTQTLIGDGFMVYRLFVVWDHRRSVVIVPAILFSIDLISGYLYHVFEYASFFVAIAFFAFSFFTNTLSSTLIMWRVLRSKSPEAQDHWRWHSRAIFNFVPYRRVFEAIIQSAAIYSMASISLLVTMFISPDVGLYACLNVFPPLIGLVFSLIVIQIGRSTAPRPRHTPSGSTESGGPLSTTADARPYAIVRLERESSPLPLHVLNMSQSKHVRRSLSESEPFGASVDTFDDASRVVQLSQGSTAVDA